jgi:DNA repair exonuclease SbcCD nuclease subunit
MIRILHTADIHLGRAFGRFGEFGAKLRRQVRQTLVRLLRDAAGSYDLVVLAGDVFDSNRPDVREIRALLEAVRSIDPVPVCLLPGTHDRLSGESVYLRSELSGQCPSNLRIFREGSTTFPFNKLRLAIHGRATPPDTAGQSPLDGIQPSADARFNVAVAHASIPLAQADVESSEEYCLRPEQAAASGMNYIALGHWHRFRECFPAIGPPVFFAGSPEPVEFDGAEAAGSYARVLLSESGVQVEREASGHYQWRDLELDLTGQEDDRLVRQTLENAVGSANIVRLRLRGQPAGHWQPPSEDLEEDFGDQCAYVGIQDQTTRQTDIGQLRGHFIANSVGDFFCRATEERLGSAPAEERTHWQEVLRRGTALLLGREEVGE